MIESKIIYFDLFFTLITPSYCEGKNEYDVLNMTKDEWELYAEENTLYQKRATGLVMSGMEIINDIVHRIPMDISKTQKEELNCLRENRMKQALTNLDSTILQTLIKLKQSGYRLCLISNADVMDVMHWNDSELSNLFDQTVFSYEVGYLKPDVKIYEIAIERMGGSNTESYFIGDGGSSELRGAKEFGMITILTEYLDKKEGKTRDEILRYADYCVDKFSDILNIIGIV
jgi:putative hydrolase of the HAD superfamily